MQFGLPLFYGVAILCVCFLAHLWLYYCTWLYLPFSRFVFVKHSHVWISELGTSCLSFAFLDGEFLEDVMFRCSCFLVSLAKFILPQFFPLGFRSALDLVFLLLFSFPLGFLFISSVDTALFVVYVWQLPLGFGEYLDVAHFLCLFTVIGCNFSCWSVGGLWGCSPFFAFPDCLQVAFGHFVFRLKFLVCTLVWIP